EDVSLMQEKDGVTNLLLKCTHDQETVLVRVYGDSTETIISRTRELENFVALYLQGYAPEVLNRFENGLVYRYVPGQVLNAKTVRDERYAHATASLLGEWHRVMPHSERNAFWPTLKQWVELVPEGDSHSTRRLTEQLAVLQQEAEQASNELVFSHNDLLPANIIVQSDGTEKVAFIDYEYACTHDPHFDIANHFLEYAGMDCDWETLPSEAHQRHFVAAYLESFHQRAPDDAAIHATMAKVNTYKRVSHFYWGVWALVQASISKIDFDYAAYAQRRL
ncbi:kinase-like domain-containing protein, partial [Protomyces lactucae-debilis]